MYDQWFRGSPKAHPYIKLNTTVHPDDYAKLGFNLNGPARSSTISIMTDTGSQCCLASSHLLHELGLTEGDLIPVKMEMHATNKNPIIILGAVVLRFSGKSDNGKILETRQFVYIMGDDALCNVLLSHEACVSLGIVSAKFPSIDENSNNISKTHCSCAKQPPPRSASRPFPDLPRVRLQYSSTGMHMDYNRMALHDRHLWVHSVCISLCMCIIVCVYHSVCIS